MGKNKQARQSRDVRSGASPYNKLSKDPGVPKLPTLKKKERQHDAKHSQGSNASMRPPPPPSTTIASLAQSTLESSEDAEGSFSGPNGSRLQRDSTVAAHAHQFKKVLELADVVIQVLDARDPLGCRSRVVEDEVRRANGDKMLILALNKTDLVPKENVLAWLRYLRHDYPTVPIKSSPGNSHHHRGSNSKAKDAGGAPHLLTLLKSYRKAHSSLTIGVVGPPNVGKSSLINSLARLRARGGTGDVVTVGAKPGETRAIKEVGLEKGLKILDMPGIVWGDFKSEDTGVEGSAGVGVGSLNMMGVEFLEDPIGAVETIVSRVPAETLQQIYSVPTFANYTEFLVMVALSRGRLGKGGAPDQLSTARSILSDWNSGAIPYHTVPPTLHTSSIPSAPRIPAGTDSSIALGLTSTADSAMMEDGAQDGTDGVMTSAMDVGKAAIVSKFSEAFDLGGLFAEGDKAFMDEEEDEVEEGMDMDIEAAREKQDEELQSIIDETEALTSQSITSFSTRLSPTPSATGTNPFPSSLPPLTLNDTRAAKAPKPKKTRYNPNAPLVFDPVELESMASSSNPFSKKKVREEKRAKRKAAMAAAKDDMQIDDDADGGMGEDAPAPRPSRPLAPLVLEKTGGAFALLMEESS